MQAPTIARYSHWTIWRVGFAIANRLAGGFFRQSSGAEISFHIPVEQGAIDQQRAQNDWPTVVLHDFSSLGAQTNPILIEDDDAPLGSESNPILIYVEEDYGYVEDEQIKSDADTDIMATLEPWWEQMFRDSVDLLADSATDVDAEVLTTPESWWDM